VLARAESHRGRPGGDDVASSPRTDGEYFVVAAHLVVLAFATNEVGAFWSLRGAESTAQLARRASIAVLWTAQGAALAWMGLRGGRGWIRLVGLVLLLVGLSRGAALLASPAPPGYMVGFNPRVAALVFVVATLYALAFLWRRVEGTGGAASARHEKTILVLLANVLTLATLSAEIETFWSRRAAGSTAEDALFARGMTLSITWAMYAAGLIVVGFLRRYAPVRYLAIAIFALTIGKVFLVDMAELERFYRILSILVLGVVLLVTSFLYQRYRSRLAETLIASDRSAGSLT
jgi:uncharacterized membrane protein